MYIVRPNKGNFINKPIFSKVKNICNIASFDSDTTLTLDFLFFLKHTNVTMTFHLSMLRFVEPQPGPYKSQKGATFISVAKGKMG